MAGPDVARNTLERQRSPKYHEKRRPNDDDNENPSDHEMMYGGMGGDPEDSPYLDIRERLKWCPL